MAAEPVPARGRRRSGANQPDLAEARALLAQCHYRGPAVAMEDIVGHAAAKRELAVVAEGFRRPEVAASLGLTLVRGLVIIGAPGTGKSMLAKALASAVERPAYVLPSAEMTPVMLRHIYEALAGEPCVVIWDEVQALIGEFASDKLTAAFCTALDGVQPSIGPITIGLTSVGEGYLDEAAIRSGRLTTKISILPPNPADRVDLWRRATSAVPASGEIDLDEAADASAGMTGADIEATVAVALGLAMVEGADALTPEALAEALDRRGHVRESVPDPEPPIDQWHHAIHEAGHAIYAAIANGPDTVFSARLLRGGYPSPETATRFSSDPARAASRADVLSAVRVCFAGRVAEELVFGEDSVTTNVSHDLARATRLLLSLAGAGLLDGFPPVDLTTIEDRNSAASDALRSLRDAAVREQAAAALHDVRAVLSSRSAAIIAFAHELHGHPRRWLEDVELEAALAAALVPGRAAVH